MKGITMQHKNIAVLMTALDSDPQAETLKGIETFGKIHNFNIAVFLWYTGAYEKDKHNQGEVNIANLPDLNLFDGVIVFSNTLHLETNRLHIEKLLEEVHRPIVGIGCRLKNAYSVQSDNYTAMREIVEHFVVHHGMTRIHFVKGIEGNEDGEARYQAYVDVLQEHGIPLEPERVTQGDFYVPGGELAVREILENGKSLPQAVVCANDTMAITVCDLLMERGYRVPGDIAVAGYDYSLEGQNHDPSITSVRSQFWEIGSAACQVILDVLEGRTVQREQYLPDEVVLNESCGCEPKQGGRLTGGTANPEALQRRLTHDMILLEKRFMENEGYQDWTESMKAFIAQIRPKEFYYCAADDFVNQIFEVQAVEQEAVYQEEHQGFPEKVQVLVAYRDGKFVEKGAFLSKYALDELFQSTERPRLYIFSPIHYLERNYGYVVLADSIFPMANPLYISWLINMGDNIEIIRKQNQLKVAMQRLDEMYIRDSLTGVLNRFGLERYFRLLKKECIKTKKKLQVSFVDIDNLKKINDGYGHEEGDRVINAAAGILEKQGGRQYVIRYGGDEFIVMGIVETPETMEHYWQQVCRDIQAYNQHFLEKHGKQYGECAELSLSYGYDVFEVDPDTDIEDCIHVSDNKMYVQKKEKKRQRNEG